MRRGREQINALSEAIHQLARVTDGIQKGVLDTRMVPIGPLFERFQRVIRDLRLLSHKEVTLHIEGEKTELDKRMIDELADPLIHMVRNSVDHGLETPDEREKAGKPRSGTVSLHASHRGNSVVIIVGRRRPGDRLRAGPRRRSSPRAPLGRGGPPPDRSPARPLHLASRPEHGRGDHRHLRPRGRDGHRQEPDRGPERDRRRPIRARPGDDLHDPPAADPGDHALPARPDLRRGLRDPARPHRRDRRGRDAQGSTESEASG